MEKQPKFDYSDIKFKDNGKLKLIIVVGTRPEIIRLAAVINKCRQYFDVILAHTVEKKKIHGGKQPHKIVVSLWLDNYDNIFSDFDPRSYAHRELSDDFLIEAKKVTHEF